MPKRKLSEIIDEIDRGKPAKNIANAPEVTFSVKPSPRSIRMVPIEASLLADLEKFAKEKKTTVEKLLNNMVKKIILKAA